MIAHRRRPRALGALSAATALCLATPVATASTDPSGLSEYGKRIYRAMSGYIWSPDVISYDNTVEKSGVAATDWLILTPPASEWGTSNAAAGHSSFFPLRIKSLLASATQWIDITTLGGGDGPSGPFMTNILAALRELDAAGKEVTVRILLGEVTSPGEAADPTTANIANRIVTATKAFKKVKVYTARHLPGAAGTPYFSWSHAKIIAVDGAKGQAGGHNLGEIYLGAPPSSFLLHDVSMQVNGEAGHHAHEFAQDLWDEICAPGQPFAVERGSAPIVNSNDVAKVGGAVQCPPKYNLTVAASTPSAKSVPVIAMGRPSPTYARFVASLLAYVDPSPADVQIHAIIRSAERSVYISQQDIGPRLDVPGPQLKAALARVGLSESAATSSGLLEKSPKPGVDKYGFGGWPIVADLADAVLRGVHVYVVTGEVENDWATGWSIQDNGAKILAEMQKVYGGYASSWFSSDAKFRKQFPNVVLTGGAVDIKATACKFLHVAGFRRKPKSVPGVGAATNHQLTHGKIIIGDRQGFYIGSQNLYYSPLAEFGYFVDHEDTAKDFIRQYWAPVWSYAREDALSGGADPNVPGAATAADAATGEKGEAGLADPSACVFLK